MRRFVAAACKLENIISISPKRGMHKKKVDFLNRLRNIHTILKLMSKVCTIVMLKVAGSISQSTIRT